LERCFSDGDIVREVKVLLFLKEIVLPMRIPCRRKSGTVGYVIAPSRGNSEVRKRRKSHGRDGGYKRQVRGNGMRDDSDSNSDQEEYFSANDERGLGSKLLTPQSIESSYVSALVDLWAQQVVDETNRHPTARGRLLKALLQANKIDRARHSHDNFEDRAICSLNDGYTALEYRQLAKNTIAKTESVQQWLRTRLDIQLLHTCVLRSESTRRLELPDMAVKLLGGEGAEGGETPCLIISFTEGKTVSVGVVDYIEDFA
jgi:hypothetical protein